MDSGLIARGSKNSALLRKPSISLAMPSRKSSNHRPGSQGFESLQVRHFPFCLHAKTNTTAIAHLDFLLLG